MPHWMVKAAIQGAISTLPQPQRLNRMFKVFSRTLDMTDDFFIPKWEQCQRHVSNLRRHGTVPSEAFTALEIGTGWFPVVPIGLSLLGARTIYSVDMQDLLSKRRLADTLRKYAELVGRGRIEVTKPGVRQQLDAALARTETTPPREVLGDFGIVPIIADARSLDLESGSVDLLCSNNTLEHIPRDIIEAIFKEFRRLCAPHGVMSHHIDMGDHYANFDRSISVYNFLKYSERSWPLFNNSLQYQNRLRVSDFRDVHDDTGWHIVEEEDLREPVEVLRSVKLAPCFQRYSEEDLTVYEAYMTSRPATGSVGPSN